MKFRVSLVLGFVASFATFTVYLCLDLLLNGPWLQHVDFTWGRVFTTRHGIAMLYYHNFTLCIAAMIVLSMITGLSLALRAKD